MRIPSFRRVLPFTSGLLLGVAGTGIAASLNGSDIFTDVPRGAYYDTAVGSLNKAGIITGYGDGTFGPDDYVTRGQVAVMIQRLRAELGVAESVSSSSRSRSTSSASSSSSSSSSSASSIASNPKGFIRFTLADFSVEEDDGTLTISVVRTGGTEGTVKVDYELEAGTATAGTDYEVVSGTLTFLSGVSSGTFQVKILNDSVTEGSEAITLKLLNVTGGASLGTPSTATLTIRDDETSASAGSAGSSSSSILSVGFGALEYAVAENGGTINVTVTRTSTSGTASVNYATSDGTGKSGTEYTSTNGTITFASGEAAKTFPVTIIDDEAVDGNKTFKVTLSSPVGASLGTTMATVTINDNEASAFGSGSFRFSKSEYTGTEASGGAIITVLRQGGASGIVSVNYATNGGTATVGKDYTAVSGTLTFAHGEASKTFTVPILSDTEIDSGEGINLVISGPTGGSTLGSVTAAILYLYE